MLTQHPTLGRDEWPRAFDHHGLDTQALERIRPIVSLEVDEDCVQATLGDSCSTTSTHKCASVIHTLAANASPHSYCMHQNRATHPLRHAPTQCMRVWSAAIPHTYSLMSTTFARYTHTTTCLSRAHPRSNILATECLHRQVHVRQTNSSIAQNARERSHHLPAPCTMTILLPPPYARRVSTTKHIHPTLASRS